MDGRRPLRRQGKAGARGVGGGTEVREVGSGIHRQQQQQLQSGVTAAKPPPAAACGASLRPPSRPANTEPESDGGIWA